MTRCGLALVSATFEALGDAVGDAVWAGAGGGDAVWAGAVVCGGCVLRVGLQVGADVEGFLSAARAALSVLQSEGPNTISPPRSLFTCLNEKE